MLRHESPKLLVMNGVKTTESNEHLLNTNQLDLKNQVKLVRKNIL